MGKGKLGMKRKLYILILITLAFPVLLKSQTLPGEDSLFLQQLSASYVSEYKNTSMISGNSLSSISFDIESLDKFPKLFGQSDPIRFVQSLPGVQTASIFEPGINVLGCNNSQNEFSLAGAPFYPAPRFLGLFPLVNTDAFTQIKFKNYSTENFLGGSLSMDFVDSLATSLHAAASVGMISSQATAVIPVSSKLDVTVSARKSYLNLLYGSLMNYMESSISYDFWDLNASAKWQPDDKNSVDATLFYSRDNGVVDVWNVAIFGDWNQKLGVGRWTHKGRYVNQKHTIYASDTKKLFTMDQQSGNTKIDMFRKELGWKSELELPYEIVAKPLVSYYNILPQNAYMDTDFKAKQKPQSDQKALLASIEVERLFETGNFKFVPQITLNYYNELGFENNYFHFDPSVRVEYNMNEKGILALDFGRKHQFLTELTILPSAVPMQFWIANGHYRDPQVSYFTTLSHSVNLEHGKWSLTSQLYWKNVYNQLEFNGFYLTMALSEYSLEDYLLPTEGYNFGGSIMFSKNSGRLTGWISYAYGRALRKTDYIGYPTIFSASYERPHELNLVASYEIGRFILGGTLVWASGTPYTPIKNFYVFSDSILSEFADYNSGRLPSYFRVDLSATWNFKTKGRFRHGMNLSIYNATASKDVTGYCMQFDEEGNYYYGPVEWTIRVIPSLSYFIKL